MEPLVRKVMAAFDGPYLGFMKPVVDGIRYQVEKGNPFSILGFFIFLLFGFTRMETSLFKSVEILLCSIIIIYLLLSRVVPFLLAWGIQYKYNCSITIGRISLPYFALKNVVICKHDLTIIIDRVGFTSSLVKAEAPKLLSVIISSVNIIKSPKENPNEASSSKNSFFHRGKGNRRKFQAPAVISNLVQFLGIQINHTYIWIWEKLDEKKGIHFNVKIGVISFDGCTTVGGLTSSACIVVDFDAIDGRVSENWLPTNEDLLAPIESSYFNGRSGLTLLEWEFGLRINLLFSPKNSGDFMEHMIVDIDKLSIAWSMKDKSILLYRKWLGRQPTKLGKEEMSDETNQLSFVEKIENVLLTQFVPKEIQFRVFETECKIPAPDSPNDFESFINGFSFTSRCHVSTENSIDHVTFESQVNLGLLRIETDTNQFLSVDQFSNYINLSDCNLKIDLDVTNLSLKSYEKALIFQKSKLGLNSALYNQFPKGELNLKEIFQSLTLKLESSEFDIENAEKSGSFSSVFLEAEIKDLKNIFEEENCAMELVIKDLNTAWNCHDEGIYKPIYFDLLGFSLKRQKLGGKLEGSRVQWIPKVEDLLLYYFPHEKTKKSGKDSEAKKEKKEEGRFLDLIKGINVEVFNSKITFMSENNMSLNLDLGELYASSDKKNKQFVLERLEVFSSSNFSDCTLSPFLMIPKCKLKSRTTSNSSRLEFSADSDSIVYWAPLLHLQILHVVKKLKNLRKRFAKKGKSKELSRTIYVKFQKNFSFIAKLAKNHCFELNTCDWGIEKGEWHFDWNVKVMKLKFDGLTIVNFDDFTLSKGPQYKEFTKAYRATANLTLKQNNAWFVDISKLSFTFPYGYNFASAFSEEFLTVFKWVKKGFAKKAPEPPKLGLDISIKIHSVRIEVGDDPFEVKLRDNYELLEDEYFENLKRFSLLDTKINQLYKTNLLISSSKIDELRNQLKEKGSSIYIQRSKKLYKDHPIRTHLLLWELEEIQIISMQDPCMFGAEKVKGILQELDPESPWPSDGMEFTTLWCRSVRFDVNKWRVQLRDFQQPLMDSKDIHFFGRLAAAEVLATKRSVRECEIEVGGPYESIKFKRSMNGLKWFYDLNCEVDSLSVAFGPCWEPVLAQCNLAFDNIFSKSKDPSRPLPFWDKIRLLFHGRLYLAVNTLTHLLHASLNPYNTTEEMEVTWTKVCIAWTNGKILFEGDLNIYVRTASKYDDCRMIHLPSVRLTFKLNWICLADANDHYGVIPCAPDKIPEYSSNQEHDSFRAFRSQNLNMNISLETRNGKIHSCPTAVLYGSTLRWFENLKLILSGTTRPTRRGVVFNNTKPKKIPISRHYKKIRVSISLNRFHVCYWVSFSMQSGIELFSGKLSSSSEHCLALQPINDGLIHRPKADWSIMYVNSELNETEIWLQASLQQGSTSEMNFRKPIEKFFFMSIDKLSYGREAFFPPNPDSETPQNDTPQHRLVVHELKGAWTSSNRDVAFALFDSFVKVQQLKKNLSTEALKSFFSKHDGPNGSPIKSQNDISSKKGSDVTSPSSQGQGQRPSLGTSPISSSNQGQNAAASLLQKLISESESRGVVFSEDLTAPPPQQSLHGVAQSSLDDVIRQNWLIELVNCQVLLKGCETTGYVILSASKAHIIQKEHKPVWKHGTIVPKTTWVGALEGMQYYATVSAGTGESPDQNIQWLSVENIEERATAISNAPEMVGSGQSVGGVVSETVGAAEESISVQLQRIVSRCKCEFFYTTYGETGVEKIPSGIPEIPPAPKDVELWDEIHKPVEAFTLMHYDLNVFTNSLQYAMIMDIVNNLVLYVDPKRKEGFEKLQRLRFKLQLQSTEAQRRPIQQLQNHLRNLVNQLRRLEKETYSVQKSLLEDSTNELLLIERDNLEQQVNDCKEQVAAKGEELHMMIMCYKETKLAASQRLSRKRDNRDVSLVRIYEICFKHAQWRLTQTDGQLGIADLLLSNFLYTKGAKSDDSIEHLCELGYITVTNLLPNQVYKEVLVPSHIHPSMPIDRQRTLRVFCRDRPPVGGIAVKEHFEINISPITIGMTYQFFKTLFKFCFPEKDPEKLDDVELGEGGEVVGNNLETQSTFSGSVASLPSKGKKSRVRRKESKFYVAMNEKDDVEKMKERADKNMLFICVKIPEVPVRVSYKGEKEKNIEDVHDVHLTIPTLEYNNITWTWLDFLVAVRNHSKRVLLSQAIKQKLQIWPKGIWHDNTAGPQEEDKAKMLLGLPGESKGIKKSIFKK